ncbi:MAG: valine--tRNA ligase [Desulfobacteraceae bacterium]|nr:valine--tRNA ligase [Desulfobacteraceae bacterium]
MTDNSMDKAYEHNKVEQKWYDFWEKNGYFRAEEESDKPPFSIVIPPPNVTGVLHMGHALNITLQDILCRYKKLNGFNVLWMPGTDHAGIATQNVVEKKLKEEGLSRHDLGRDKFIERVWEWRGQYGSAIINQLKRLGASCDWDRERFTMDEGLSTAVKKVFEDLYNDGLIYKGDYIINWCPRCKTALADLEVEHEEKDGALYHIRYPFAQGDGELIVATTRPETMFGDTAVAINPEDERYLNLPCDHVLLPLTDRKIPIIKDSYVDTKFGTGALKVTPAHDPNDFEIGVRHNLPHIKALDDDAIMTEEAGEFKGLDRFECRKQAVKKLKELGYLVKTENIKHSVGQCYRCDTVVEPNLSKQWFVKTKPLAEKAIEAVKNGDTKILPEQWEKTYYNWLENIRDWCISRQIWWGHQIPAWTCDDCQKLIVSSEEPQVCDSCKSSKLTRDPDVLDTWFSSALWPFSTMGWPEDTKLLNTFYPTSVLVTGFDILFFWIARMMMMGLYFKQEVPFKDVYVHALVRDEEGNKMSKSRGNVIDPLVVIDEYGTDAFRFTLAIYAAMGRDVKMSEKRVEGYRHFINKLWNASRFSLMHLDREYDDYNEKLISLPDKWILSRLNSIIRKVKNETESYRFNEVGATLYQFVWHELCDWYLEAVKPILFGKQGEDKMNASKGVLQRVMKDALSLLHPVIPFVTEEIWNKIPGTRGSIMNAGYPGERQDKKLSYSPESEVQMEYIMNVVSSIRNIRGEMNIQPGQLLKAHIQTRNFMHTEIAENETEMIKSLARLSELVIEKPGERPKSAAAAIVDTDTTIFVPLEGVIDVDKEISRIEKEIAKVDKELIMLGKKLSNDNFLDKAPENVVKKTKNQHDEFSKKLDDLNVHLEKVREMLG